ncbi:PREDICTED: taste receptor type 2 member 40-like [Nanorana parkeri]|uniref:taste receptor type 2 member 40-like n=1 Tax=Nanorana parkeri TaxID=125878 RepID=UPI000854181F|nr:PREDICTED: taste receptor type 2 member 40-like [Nanorana parkeri]
MDSLLKSIFTAVLLAECFVGIQINSFIVAVFLRKFKVQKSLEACEKIITCLGVFRSFRMLHSLTYYFLEMYFPWLIRLPAFLSASLLIGLFFNLANLWITTVLCVFYCVKITNFSHKLFIFLKPRISRLAPWLLVASLLISLLFSLPAGWRIVNVQQQNSTVGAMNNRTMHDVLMLNGQNRLTMFLVPSSLPFMIFCVAVSLLIRSLLMHSIQMKSSGTGFGNPDLEVHLNVVKSMVLFLFCQMLYYISACFTASESMPRDGPWKVSISIVTNASPLIHSVFIIASNSKLKETWLEMWHGLTKMC